MKLKKMKVTITLRLHAREKVGNKWVMNGMGGRYGHEGFDGYIRYEVKGESVVMGFAME